MGTNLNTSDSDPFAWFDGDSDFDLNQILASLADQQTKHNKKKIPTSTYTDLCDFELIIKSGYQQYQESSELLVNLSPAAEWMLDNYIIVEQAFRLIRDNLPFSYESQLPRLLESPYKNRIRILILTLIILRRTDFLIDESQFQYILMEFQKIQSLSTGELWAFPTMLRFGLLAALAYSIHNSPELTIKKPLSSQINNYFEKSVLLPEEMIARIIPGLRQLSAINWQTFFEACSPVENIFNSDPSHAYAEMDFDTRDHYRRSLEDLSVNSKFSEERIARIIVELCEMNKQSLVSPHPNGDFSQQILKRKTHIGYYLLDEGIDELKKSIHYRPRIKKRIVHWMTHHPALNYVGSILLITCLALGFLILWLTPTLHPLLTSLYLLTFILPVLSISIGMYNFLLSKLLPPRHLPKMDFSKGIPDAHRTAIVIPSLLGSKTEINSLVKQIEKHYLSNTDPNLSFILLTDFTDAPQETMPEDEHLLSLACAGIESLNQKYEPVFYLFHRQRLWNPSENTWMGWERKRGKLAEFNQYILDPASSSFQTIIGNPSNLKTIRYAITLDSDTDLPFHTARKLIAGMAHPLNQAVFDPTEGRVTHGYAILQPRVQINPAFGLSTWFSKIYLEDTYFDLYTLAVSDSYMDLFGEGIFIGKGIYDIRAFTQSMNHRILENTLLSHDLFEGIFSRVALVSDIVIYEDYPTDMISYLNRQHRWIRGDWQLTPWLLPIIPNRFTGNIVNGCTFMGQWKIWDNLRRSLLPPSMVILLFLTWYLFPEQWVLGGGIVLFTYFLPVLIKIINQGFRSFSAKETVYLLARSCLGTVMLVSESAVNLDAITSVLYRIYVSRKRLLQWVTAAHTIRLSKSEPKQNLAWRRIIKGNVVVIFGFILIIIFQFNSIWPSLPWLSLWLLAPKIATLISRPIAKKETELPPRSIQVFRNIAIRTWMFFETYVGPDDSWLPPDHYQESPKGVVAHRTSPTNIGLYLLAAITGHEFGYVTTVDLVYRLQRTLETITKMGEYRGHLYNWYDTQSLLPLPPRYISTVDSGNLAACYLTLNHYLEGIKNVPILQWQQFEALADCFSVIKEIINEIPLEEETQAAKFQIEKMSLEILSWKEDSATWISNLRVFIENRLSSLEDSIITLVGENSTRMDSGTINAIRVWVGRTHFQAENILSDFLYLAPWVLDTYTLISQIESENNQENGAVRFLEILKETLALPATNSPLETIDLLLQKQRFVKTNLFYQASIPLRLMLEAWCENLDEYIDKTRKSAQLQTHNLEGLCKKLNKLYKATEFGFLFHNDREVFHIGYNLETGLLDNNYYDLLASESRIASLIAIAKGDIPQSHWKHLARPITRMDDHWALLSWSATMFEYLMPTAIMKTPPTSLLGISVQNVIDHQIKYAAQHKVPWGISESGYYHFDAQLNYQYRAFGTPGLGLKRGLGDDLVIAPYASLMCINQAPDRVFQNIDDLNRRGARGVYGYYEAIDFTTKRAPEKEGRLVKSYMAHHQGMVMAAICNYLKSDLLVKAFHKDPQINAQEILLYETLGGDMPVEFPHKLESVTQVPQRRRIVYDPWRPSANSDPPAFHILSNGKFHVAINSDGGGYSCYEERELTRWRNDASLNQYGAWYYLFDHDKQRLWSISEMPMPEPPDYQEIAFYPHKVEYTKSLHEIAARMDVLVPSDDNLEIRRVRISNQSAQSRSITISSYSEIILSTQLEDQRHPAFNKLFIDNTIDPAQQCEFFSRRLRSGEEKPLHYAHAWFAESDLKFKAIYCTDRERFLGRTGDIHTPAFFLKPENTIPPSAGNALDPIASINIRCEIPAHETINLFFLSIVGTSKVEVTNTLHKYRNSSFIHRSFEAEKIKVEHNLQQLTIEPGDLELFDKLLSLILLPTNKMRPTKETLQRNTKGQPGLWPYGISGDHPICLIKINKLDQINQLSRILKGYIFWRCRNIKIDLVLLNEKDSTYDQELNTLLQRLISKLGASPWLGLKGGIYILRADQLPMDSLIALETSANCIFTPGDEEIFDLLNNKWKPVEYLPQFHAALPKIPETLGNTLLTPEKNLQFQNHLGGFSEAGNEYHIHLDSNHISPAPWINVISNPDFGFIVSESGIGWSWAGNSGENRLTTWSNDPIQDQPGEALYLRDEETGQFWSPTLLPSGTDQPYHVIHGMGYSIFRHCSHGILSELTLFTDKSDPVKFIRLRIKNMRDRISRISTTYYAEWVLGAIKNQNQFFIQQNFDTYLSAIFARNRFNPDFSQNVSFLAATRDPQGITTNRAEFIGRNGSYRSPAAFSRVALSGNISSAHDPCAAMNHIIWLSPGEEKEITYLLGQGKDEQDAKRLVHKYQKIEQVEAAFSRSTRFWSGVTTSIQVKTPEPSFDLLLNQWLLYQSASCRFFGRSAFYQSSGAFGFRDQLQDSLAYLPSHPEWTRDFILEAAKHQFIEGDVLHWWHPPGNRGVRTRCSDDMVWLPYVVAEYIQQTGDESILDERIPFLEAPELKNNEHDRYDLYPQENMQYSIMEHCLRAIRRSATEGRHGLPFIGSHDWNDGFSRIGSQGQGESVWLGWFLAVVAERFAVFCTRQHKPILANELNQIRDTYIHNILTQAWDGKWFVRAFFDDGTPLGSASNAECKIDAIAQSWGVFAGLKDDPKVKTALESVKEYLVLESDQLILLFTPPLDKSKLDPGYVKGYRPGIRENGGQYTHAAMWTIWAFAEAGQAELAFKLFQLTNPILHSDSEQKARLYAVEPYVVAADIYNAPALVGRGGWTWYTGSASWMYRLGIERILGLQLQKDGFTLDPSIPADWEEFQLTMRLPKGRYDVTIRNPLQVNSGIAAVSMDGQKIRSQVIPWMEDGKIHTVIFRMGSE